MAWDDGGPQGWIGEFTLPGTTLFSNFTDWECYVSDSPSPGTADPPVSVIDLAAEIAAAVWSTPLASAPNGSGPWGTISGISSDADWIWHDWLSRSGESSSSSDGRYAVFRTKNPVAMASAAQEQAAIPEPSTLAIWSLLGLAGAGFGAWRKRRTR